MCIIVYSIYLHLTTFVYTYPLINKIEVVYRAWDLRGATGFKEND